MAKRDSDRKASGDKHSTLGRRLISSAKQILAHARGEISLPMKLYHVPNEIDVRAIREQTGLSQADFAGRYALSRRELQEWEQGRRRPDPAVRAYLIVIRHDPDAVVRALQADGWYQSYCKQIDPNRRLSDVDAERIFSLRGKWQS